MKIQASNLTIIVKNLKPKDSKDATFVTQAKDYEEGEIVSISPMIEDDTLTDKAVGKTLIYIDNEDNKDLDSDHVAVHYDYVVGVQQI